MLLVQRRSARARLRDFFLGRFRSASGSFIRRNPSVLHQPARRARASRLLVAALNDHRIISVLPEAVGRCKPA